MGFTASEPALHQARQAYREGRLAEARKLLLGLLAQIGKRADIFHLLGLVEATRGGIASADRAFAGAAALSPGDEDIYRDWAAVHSQIGALDRAEQIFRQGIRQRPTSRRLLLNLAALKRDSDERDDAALVLDHLLKSVPGDAQTLHLRALTELERGGDARPHYRRALAAMPGDGAVKLGLAAALHGEGDTRAAIQLLEGELQREPAWLEGLQALARIRWEHGEGETFTAGYRKALAGKPRDLTLWAAFLGWLASGLRFEGVLEHVSEARRQAGEHPLFDMMEAQALSETGRHAAAERRFEALEPLTDPSFVPVRLRALLRTGRPAEAARLGERFAGGPGANFIWPLLGLAWRVLDDRRWPWLERYDDTVAVLDLPLDGRDLEEAAALLRRLHSAKAHPYDQSARGGTQTTGNLFGRTDPPIAKLRKAVRNAVDGFIAGLPAFDESHPFLGRRRGAFRFAGSWSIRLQGSGYHVSHVHPAGWISSALYLALPNGSVDDPPAAGWLALGEPPPELELDLPPIRLIEPKVGRLVLFPSTMWHGTVPFSSGERLTAAFDVVPFGG